MVLVGAVCLFEFYLFAVSFHFVVSKLIGGTHGKSSGIIIIIGIGRIGAIISLPSEFHPFENILNSHIDLQFFIHESHSKTGRKIRGVLKFKISFGMWQKVPEVQQ